MQTDDLEFKKIFVEFDRDEFQFREMDHQHIFVLMGPLLESDWLADGDYLGNLARAMCFVFCDELQFLGHVVSEECVFGASGILRARWHLKVDSIKFNSII